jgi:superoxide dismutase, Fe-Mn family
MEYKAMDFSKLIGMDGFSDTLLNNHFTLYQGYVKNVNTLMEKLKTAEAGKPEFNEMTRRFGWEFNGMRLHELYFGNMSKDKHEPDAGSPLLKKMIGDFGSGETCKDNFVNIASLRGIGWAVTYYDQTADQIFNIWVDDHATNHLAGCIPLIVMDMWEHAFMIDYGLKKGDYINAFLKNIDWEVAEKRYANAQS